MDERCLQGTRVPTWTTLQQNQVDVGVESGEHHRTLLRHPKHIDREQATSTPCLTRGTRTEVALPVTIADPSSRAEPLLRRSGYTGSFRCAR